MRLLSLCCVPRWILTSGQWGFMFDWTAHYPPVMWHTARIFIWIDLLVISIPFGCWNIFFLEKLSCGATESFIDVLVDLFEGGSQPLMLVWRIFAQGCQKWITGCLFSFLASFVEISSPLGFNGKVYRRFAYWCPFWLTGGWSQLPMLVLRILMNHNRDAAVAHCVWI